MNRGGEPAKIALGLLKLTVPAEVIITFDLAGFPDDALKEYSIRSLHPDDFLLDQLDLYPDATKAAIRGMLESWANPPFTLDEILEALARIGVPQFATEARLAFP